MPRILYQDNGNEVEVPEEKELEELKAKAEKAGKSEELNTLLGSIRQTLGLKEEDDLMASIKEAKEAANPNFKVLRSKIGRLEAFIKANNKDAQLDDEGNVVNPQAIDSKKIIEDSKKAAIGVIFDQQISQKLKKYPEDKREVVKAYFNKLSAGEEVNSENIEKYFKESEGIVFPTGTPSTQNIEGGEPVLREDKDRKDFTETEEGVATAKAMDLPFTKEADKGGKENK